VAIRLHGDVADAVRSGDAAAADAAMRAILTEAATAVREVTGDPPEPRSG
jgi:DNA-binding FadR family transcriptional regulator